MCSSTLIWQLLMCILNDRFEHPPEQGVLHDTIAAQRG
jgi:hypothetical protein